LAEMSPEGQSRQEVEAGIGWYFNAGQEVQTPAARYLPAAQPVQSARRLEPVPVVVWPAGQFMQVVEAGTGWYFDAGQEVQTPAARYLPVAQPVQPEVLSQASPALQAGQSRQEDEAGTGWYFEAGQEVQSSAPAYLPAAQPVQSARRLEPVPMVIWPAGQSRQEVEAGAGWYFEAGQDTHADTGGAQSLKPRPLMLPSE
jgi:uncharacterized cupin superfamily protein